MQVFKTIEEVVAYVEAGNETVLGCKVEGELFDAMVQQAKFPWMRGIFGIYQEFLIGEGEEIIIDENGIIIDEHFYSYF